MIKQRNIWWDAEVVDVDSESPDINNPNFHILQKDSSEDMINFSQISDSDYFLEPLINNYLKQGNKVPHPFLMKLQFNLNIFTVLS